MMTLENVLEYFAKGYTVYGGSYYSESLMKSAEEITDNWEDGMWFYIESVEVDEDAHEIHFFIGNDE